MKSFTMSNDGFGYVFALTQIGITKKINAIYPFLLRKMIRLNTFDVESYVLRIEIIESQNDGSRKIQ